MSPPTPNPSKREPVSGDALIPLTIPLDRPEPIQAEIPIDLPEQEPQPLGDLARDDDD
jgi:hypothetical protein